MVGMPMALLSQLSQQQEAVSSGPSLLFLL